MKVINKIGLHIFDSFLNNNAGFSARKLSSFAAIVIAIYITVFNVKSDNAIEFVYAWLLFSLLCLGIITAAQLIDLNISKNGSTKNNSEEVS